MLTVSRATSATNPLPDGWAMFVEAPSEGGYHGNWQISLEKGDEPGRMIGGFAHSFLFLWAGLDSTRVSQALIRWTSEDGKRTYSERVCFGVGSRRVQEDLSPRDVVMNFDPPRMEGKILYRGILYEIFRVINQFHGPSAFAGNRFAHMTPSEFEAKYNLQEVPKDVLKKFGPKTGWFDRFRR